MFPACQHRVRPDRRAGSRGPWEPPHPAGLQGCQPPHLGPASQQAKQVAAGLLQQGRCCRLRTCSWGRCRLWSPSRFTAKCAHHWGCGQEMPPPPAIGDPEVRSQAQPDWTKHFLPSPGPALSPASGVPHPSGCCLFKDTLGAPARSPGSPVLHSGRRPLPPATHHHHEGHGSPGKAPSGGH